MIEIIFILCVVIVLLIGFYIIMKILQIRRDKKINKEYKEDLQYSSYSLSNKLDDICIKHHGALPYYPEDY